MLNSWTSICIRQTKKINNQWNSYNRSGGTANHHAFMIPADPSFKSKLVHELYPKMDGNAFAFQKGLGVSGTTVNSWHIDDYATYASVNFGEPGTTKGIKVNYAKSNDGGKMEIRLGGPTGTIIAEFTPAHTGGWSKYSTAYIGLPDGDGEVTGLQDLTFVGKDVHGVLNLAYFELSDFADRTVVHALIEGSEISTNFGVRMEGTAVAYFDDGDFVTYSQVNFGAPGATEGIILRYAKRSNGGSMEVRLGGPTGRLLGEFVPINTNSWSGYVNAYVGLDAEEVDGINDLTFVGKGIRSVLNLESFQLDARNELHPLVTATAYSSHAGMMVSNLEYISHMDDGDFITYDSLNFGAIGDTNSIKVSYAKGNDNGSVELRLDGPEGDLIGSFLPQRTAGWADFVTVDVPVDPVVGTHDLTIVTKEISGVINLESLELSDEIFFQIATDYAVNSDSAASRDIQCTFEVVKTAFIDDIYGRYYVDSDQTSDAAFWEHFNVSDDEAAKAVVTSLCETAQANMEEM